MTTALQALRDRPALPQAESAPQAGPWASGLLMAATEALGNLYAQGGPGLTQRHNTPVPQDLEAVAKGVPSYRPPHSPRFCAPYFLVGDPTITLA